MKNKGFGHLKTRLFTIKTSKNVGFEGHGIKIPIGSMNRSMAGVQVMEEHLPLTLRAFLVVSLMNF